MTDEPSQEDWNRVARAVEVRRASLRLTQKEAATRAGIGVSAWREVEGAVGRQTTPTLVRMAQALDWPDDAVLRIAEGHDPVDVDRIHALEERVSQLENLLRSLLPPDTPPNGHSTARPVP